MAQVSSSPNILLRIIKIQKDINGKNISISVELPKSSNNKFITIAEIDEINISLILNDDTNSSIENFNYKKSNNQLNLTNNQSTVKLAKGSSPIDINTNNFSVELVDIISDGDYVINGYLVSKNQEFDFVPRSFPFSTVPVKAQHLLTFDSNTSDFVEKAKGLAENIDTFVKKDFSKISLIEPKRETPPSQKIWIYIRNGVLNFNHFNDFLNQIFSSPPAFGTSGFNSSNFPAPLDQTDAYTKLKFATDFYIKRYFDVKNNSPAFFDNTNIDIDNVDSEVSRTRMEKKKIENLAPSYWLTDKNSNISTHQYFKYFEAVLERMEPFGLLDPTAANRLFNDGNFDISKLQNLNLLELIWSYWHEEGGLVQTMNALSLRFQNVRLNANDPLAGLNIDPLRPINNLIWGYIEDERNRLSMARRNLEYQYEYGISLIGPAVPVVQVAESRSQFLPAFHNLLKTSIDFYQQANYTTVIPDGFPVLNSLREVHMLLSEGAHNQFGSLPWTARSEMMIQQWLLARPEMREFLGGRIMVPYQETWMDRVDTMKTLQGWNPTNISHFHDLGAFGEQLLLSIRYGAWNDSGTTRDDAAEWAHYWREEIQRYVHAYKAATGVDLGNDVTDARIAMPQNVERYTQPSVLIGRRVNSLPNNRPNQLNRLTQRRNIERY